MKEIKVAVVQMDSSENLANNLEKIEKFVKEAAGQGAQLICFPEFSHGICIEGEALDGPSASCFRELAATYGVYLSNGSFHEKTEGKCRNTSLFWSPGGELLASYSKRHTFDVTLEDGRVCAESAVVEPGKDLVVCQTPFVNLGFSICYDLRFPEQFRKLTKMGAEILLTPANFTKPTGRDHWEILLRARAIENGAYLLAANQCGAKPEFQAYGHSMIVDPWGKILAQAGETEEILYAELSGLYLQEKRRQIPAMTRQDL